MNKDLIAQFNILAMYYKGTKDGIRQRAYDNAVGAIKQIPDKITSLKQITGVSGLGKASKEKIMEYIITGKIRKVEEVKKEMNKPPTEIEKMERVWGIGKVTAKKLWDKGIHSLAQLRKHSSKLTKQQQIGLKYYDDILSRIPRQDIDVMQMAIRYVLSRKYGLKSYRMIVAGSYRRQESSSGDMDIVITSDVFTFEEMIKTLEDWKIIVAGLVPQTRKTTSKTGNARKFMGIARCPGKKPAFCRIDIQFVPKALFVSTLLYFTGPKGTNVNMRLAANKKGWKLSEYGLTKDGDPILYEKEEDYFTALGIPYYPADRRRRLRYY
jgi:DNA polymerase/3'-5' exonuclease PolX